MTNSIEFIKKYFSFNEYFYIFLLNRSNKETKQYYNNITTFQKNYNNYKRLNKEGWDVYFSVNSFQFIEGKIYRQEKFVKENKSFFFDIDVNTEEIKNNIIKELGEPTIQIQTSEAKYQLFYCIDSNKSDLQDLKKKSQEMTYYFDTDKTFDLARVARLPFFINNKNKWEVKINKFNQKTFEVTYFDKIEYQQELQGNKLPTQKKERKKKEVTSLNVPKGKINPTYVYKYNQFLKKTIDADHPEGNYSQADMSFIVYLVKVKKLTRTPTIYKHFLNTCPNVEERHQNTEQYFLDTFNKIN